MEKAQGLRPCPVGVRGFESRPPHYFNLTFEAKCFVALKRWLKVRKAESEDKGFVR